MRLIGSLLALVCSAGVAAAAPAAEAPNDDMAWSCANTRLYHSAILPNATMRANTEPVAGPPLLITLKGTGPQSGFRHFTVTMSGSPVLAAAMDSTPEAQTVSLDIDKTTGSFDRVRVAILGAEPLALVLARADRGWRYLATLTDTTTDRVAQALHAHDTTFSPKVSADVIGFAGACTRLR